MPNGEVTCPECGKSFPGDYVLNWHRESVHRPDAAASGVVVSGNPAVAATGRSYCPKCGYLLDTNGVCGHCSQDENIRYGEEEEAKGKIKGAVIAACISAAVTLVIALTQVLGEGPGMIFDAFFLFAMAMGVLYRNRVCAVLLFIYWIISKLLMLGLGAAGWAGIPVGILFGYFFYRAIPATFSLHRIRMAKRDLAKQRAAVS